MTLAWTLLDAAMLRGSELMRAVTADANAMALYADLGEEAASVGPWLLRKTATIDLGGLGLPARLGVSQWHSDLDAAQLLQHARAIRHVGTRDGQSFYFRYADTRALSAAMKTWPAGLLHAVLGPLNRWTWVDRASQPVELRPGAVAPTALGSLVLTDAQFEATLLAGLPDRLALMLEELGDPMVKGVHEPASFALLERAAALLNGHGIEAFALQRAVARQVLLTEGVALDDASFTDALLRARHEGLADRVDAWLPSKALIAGEAAA